MATIRPPKGLGAPGRAAFRHAVAVLSRIGEDPELSRDAIARYATAANQAAAIRREWDRLGCPTTALGGHRGDRVLVHELLAAIREAERHAQQLGDELGLTPTARQKLRRRVGHPVGAGQAPDRAVVRLLRPDAS